MTQAERLTLDGMNDHVMDLKGDVGELKADVRAIKESLAESKEQQRVERVEGQSHWRSLLRDFIAAVAGAAALVGLERIWPGR
jgi:regulator of replication initiation timing